MIDVQAELYTIGRQAVLDKFPNAELSSTVTLKPTRYPYVAIVEQDNRVYRATSDSESLENHAEIMLEVTVYTTGERKQQECRAIMGEIDKEYGKIGLQRMMLNPVTNYNDTQVYRMIARYRAVISKNKEIYRR